jgi:hypothetical protein
MNINGDTLQKAKLSAALTSGSGDTAAGINAIMKQSFRHFRGRISARSCHKSKDIRHCQSING